MPISLAFLWSAVGKKYSTFLWGFTFISISHYWLLSLHPLTWLGFSWIASIIISVLIWIVCSLLGGSLVLFWGFIAKKIISGNIFSQNKYELFIKIFFLSLLWSFGELFLSQTPFFWIGVSESLIPGDIYLAGLARWIGSSGLCMIQILIGFWLFYIYEIWRRNLDFRIILIAGILIINALHFIGYLLINPVPSESPYKVAIWQPNIPSREKPYMNYNKIRNDIVLQQEKALSNRAEILILPEGTLYNNFSFNSPIKVNTLAGGFRTEKNNLRSSLLAFKENDQIFSGLIDKTRLVPLGEKIPKFLNRFSLGLSALGGLEEGETTRYFKWENIPSLAVGICYEISDGLKIKNAVNDGAELILLIANLDPYPLKLHDQFLSLARMRSIENNRDTILVSNTGPSGLVKSDGRIEKLLEPNIEDSSIVLANLSRKKTFYSKYGEKPILTILIFLIVVNVLKKLTNYSAP